MHIEKIADLTADEISSVSALIFNCFYEFLSFLLYRSGESFIKIKTPFVPLFQLESCSYDTNLTFCALPPSLPLSLSLSLSLSYSLINMLNS